MMQLAFVIPDKFNPDTIGHEKVLHRTGETSSPFLSILGLKFSTAAKSRNGNHRANVVNGTIIDSGCIYLVRDFFFEFLDKEMWTEANVESNGSRLVRLSALCSPHQNWLGIGFNSMRSDKIGNFNPSQFYNYGVATAINESNNIELPLGCAQEWLTPRVDFPGKTILLDEPHRTVLDNISNENNIRTMLYKHALDVCRELVGRGFSVRSFCRENSSEFTHIMAQYPFVDIIQAGKWLPYADMLKDYARSSLFYSWFPETFGFSIYENLQIGNGIITYNEILNPCALRQMQNSACLSLYMPPRVAADLVETYYDHAIRHNFFEKTLLESNKVFSCETYVDRMARAMIYNGIL